MKERLLLLLEKFDLTHTEFAGLVGMNNSQVSSWMTGRSALPQSTAMAFQAALGVRWQWLLLGEEPMMLEITGTRCEYEVRLLSLFRMMDITAQKDLLDQAEFQLGRSERRGDKK